MRPALGKAIALAAVAAFAVSLFLPWSSESESHHFCTLAGQDQGTVSPSRLAVPAAVAFVGSLVALCSHFAGLAGLICFAVGSAGVPLLFALTQALARVSSVRSGAHCLQNRGPGWWLCLVASVLLAVSGLLAVAAQFNVTQREARRRARQAKQTQGVKAWDVEDGLRDSAKVPPAPSLMEAPTPETPPSRDDWFEMQYPTPGAPGWALPQIQQEVVHTASVPPEKIRLPCCFDARPRALMAILRGKKVQRVSAWRRAVSSMTAVASADPPSTASARPYIDV